MKFGLALFVFLFTLSAAAQDAADLILVNANIRTMDISTPNAEALAVSAGRIIAVGNTKEISKLATLETTVIDAKGKLVLPGFNDAHVHFAGVGNNFSHLLLTTARNSSDIISRIEHYSRIVPERRWILGSGLSTATLPAKSMPSLAELDKASGGHPLIIYVDGYSSGLVNTAALRLADIDLKLVGLPLVSGGSLKTIRAAVPANFGTDMDAVIESASNYAASLGVTSIQDVHSDDLFDLLNKLDRAGKLKTRVYECIALKDRGKLSATGIKAASGNAMVRRGCVKGFADGSEGEIPELARDIADADKAGLQVMIHAIGRSPIANAVKAFEMSAAANGDRDRRFRVEHAARADLTDILLTQKANIILSMQPALFYGGPSYGDDYSRMFGEKLRIAFGSDASMIDLDPLAGIFAAVNSGTRSITVNAAVLAYTQGSAYAEFQEKEKGTLTVGKLADMVVLSDDIFTIHRKNIGKAHVVTTIVGGRVVFRADEK